MVRVKKIMYYSLMKGLVIQVCHECSGGGAEFIANSISSIRNEKEFESKAIFFKNKKKIPLKNNQIVLDANFKYSLITLIKLIFLILKLSKKYPKVILHAHLNQAFYFLVPFSYFKKFYLVTTEHGSTNFKRKYFFLKPLERFVYFRYKKIISISDFVQKKLLIWLEIDPKKEIKYKDKFLIIHNGAKLYKFVDRNLNKKKFNLLSIGNLRKAKSYDVPIKAISHCKEFINSYTILGEGKERYNLERLIAKRNLTKTVKLCGYTTEINKYLKNSDLGIISSRWEGFGLVSIEMISSGLPLCISNVGGMTDIIKDLNTVKIIDNFDENKWSKIIIESLINLKNMKEGLKKSSIFVSEFSPDNMIQKYVKEYKKIFSG